MRLPKIVPILTLALTAAACATSATPPGFRTESDIPTDGQPRGVPIPADADSVRIGCPSRRTPQGDVRRRLHQSGIQPCCPSYGRGVHRRKVLTPAPDTGRLVSRIDVRDVGATGAAAILKAIRDAGLDKEATGGPGIPGDTGTTVFTVDVDGVTTTTRLSLLRTHTRPGAHGPSVDPGHTMAFDLLNRPLDGAETSGASPRRWRRRIRLWPTRSYVAPQSAAPDRPRAPRRSRGHSGPRSPSLGLWPCRIADHGPPPGCGAGRRCRARSPDRRGGQRGYNIHVRGQDWCLTSGRWCLTNSGIEPSRPSGGSRRRGQEGLNIAIQNQPAARVAAASVHRHFPPFQECRMRRARRAIHILGRGVGYLRDRLPRSRVGDRIKSAARRIFPLAIHIKLYRLNGRLGGDHKPSHSIF